MQPMSMKDVNQQCSCFNLRKAARAVTQRFDHVLEPMGIRATQFTLLVTMASVSARTLTEMASVLVMDRTTLTRNLKPLEKMELIETVTPRDKRSKAYALTQKGREVLARSVPVWEKAQIQVVSEMGSERFNNMLLDLAAVTKIVNKSS